MLKYSSASIEYQTYLIQKFDSMAREGFSDRFFMKSLWTHISMKQIQLLYTIQILNKVIFRFTKTFMVQIKC